mmetsp:Transcript_21729/g.32090  ORF Transcript_21729/g.32090 Transcript_21729/m.32090 type:complete len:277 (+) Transcript_21729:109-939(+)
MENKVVFVPGDFALNSFTQFEAQLPSQELSLFFGCFPSHAKSQILGKGEVLMKDLNLGDEILVQGGRYEPIYSFGHRQTHSNMEYLQISTAHTKLEITPDHMVFVEGGRSIPASLIKIGDAVETSIGTYASVESISTVVRRGAFAPFTASGTIIVNGIKSSTFVSLQKSETLVIGGTNSGLTFQFLAHSFEMPHRMWCSYDLASCLEEQYTAEGVSKWVYLPYKVSTWFLEQHSIWAAVLAFPLLLFLLVMGSPMSFLLAIVAGAICRRLILRVKK